MGAVWCLTRPGASQASALLVFLGTFVIAEAFIAVEVQGERSSFRRDRIQTRFAVEDTEHRWTSDTDRFSHAFLEGSGDGEGSYKSEVASILSTMTHDSGESPHSKRMTENDYDELADGTEPSLASSDLAFIDSWGLSRTSMAYPGPSATSAETTASTAMPEPEFMTPSFNSEPVGAFASEAETLTSPFLFASTDAFGEWTELVSSSFLIDATSATDVTPHSATSSLPTQLTRSLTSQPNPGLEDPVQESETTSPSIFEDLITISLPKNDSKLIFSTTILLRQPSVQSPTETAITTNYHANASISDRPFPHNSLKSNVTFPSSSNTKAIPSQLPESSTHHHQSHTVPTKTDPPPLLSSATSWSTQEASPSFTTEHLPYGNEESTYLSGPSALWTVVKARERTPEGTWHNSAESNSPTLLWFTTSPPLTRKTDWFLTTMSKWFVPRTTTLQEWSRSPPATIVRPTAVLNSFGHLGNGSEASPEALSDQMKYWIRTVLRIERYNHSNTEKLAKNLAFIYEKAFAQRQAARRGRRYTGRSMAVQVVNLSVDYKEQLMSLVYTLSQEDKLVPAETAVEAMSVVNETDMSRLLGYPVVTKAEPYIKPTKTESVTQLVWIVSGVLAAIFFLVLLFLILYCKCCRPKVHRSPFSDSGSVRSYGRANRLKAFEESPGKFGALGEKTYKDVFTSPIHVPSAPPLDTGGRTMHTRPKNLSEYFVNKAYEPDRHQRASAIRSNALQGSAVYDEVDRGLDEIQGGLFDHVLPPPSESAECPLPMPRKTLQMEVHRDGSGSDSDTSLESTTSAESAEEKTAASAQESVATSLISDEPSEVNDSEKPGKLCSDEELKEAQKELDHMKKKIGVILDSALEKAAAKKVYGSLRRQRVSPSATEMRRTSSLKVPRPRHTMASTLLRQKMLSLPPEEPEKKDVLTQTTDLPAGKPRVVWSIYKTSEAAAQTSFLDCRLSRDDSLPTARADVGDQSPARATSIVKDSTQAMLSAIRGELQKFSVAQRTQNGESFA
ncbi:uncharacterized protein LOC144127525 [Amblyomma americanum]